MLHTAEDVTSYRIGWWGPNHLPPRLWWRCLAEGHDPTGRRAPRWFYIKLIAVRLWEMQRGLPHRPWQAEYPGCSYARRGFTRAGAEQKATGDYLHLIVEGTPSPSQRAAQCRPKPLKRIQDARCDRRRARETA